MAKAEGKVDKEAIRQRQADHFKEIMADCQEIITDPDSTPEDVTDAETTLKAMMSNLERLNTKYGVKPEGVEPEPTV